MGVATSKTVSADTFTELFSRLDIEFARVDQCRLRSAAASYDLQQRQNDIETREHDLYKKEVAAEELASSLSRREYVLASKEAAAKELEAVLGWRQATLNARESGLYAREKSLDESEAAVTMRQDALERREAAAKERESGIVWRESSLNAREASLWTREQAMGDKEEMKAKLRDLQEKLNTAEQWCEDLVSCNAEFEKTMRDSQDDLQLHENLRRSDADTTSTTGPQQDGLDMTVAGPHNKKYLSKTPSIPLAITDEVEQANDGADDLQARMTRLSPRKRITQAGRQRSIYVVPRKLKSTNSDDQTEESSRPVRSAIVSTTFTEGASRAPPGVQFDETAYKRAVVKLRAQKKLDNDASRE